MTSFEEQYYEAASFWDHGALDDPANQRRVKEIAQLVPAGVRTLLDAGCGNGVFGHHLASVRPDIAITGMDRSRTALSHVKFEKLVGSLETIPAADKVFDCVTCLQVIEHLPVQIFNAALSELQRVAARYVIIGVPYREDIEGNSTTCPRCRSRFNVDLHLDTFTEARMKGLLPDFKLTQSIFPGSKDRLWLVDDVLNKVGAARRPDPGFMSPLCPICGYSEGDRTALSSAAAPSPPRNATGPKSMAKRLLRPLKAVWPRQQAKGYWITCLYERK